MTKYPRHRIEELFAAALELPPHRRTAYLAQQEEDQSLRAEVLSLLKAHESQGRLDSIAEQVSGLEKNYAADLTAQLLGRLRTALAGRYQVERELGRGGMAIVFLAEDLKHRRRVALKVLRPDLAGAIGRERFLHEIETAGQLHHPHILPLYDSGQVDGLLYYVMPYVEGESLRERLDREQQLPLEQAIRIVREVGYALDHAHGLGVIHRDIKPENILFEGGHAVVSDFGVARAINVAGTRLTEPGIAVGTPAYMSPEQAVASASLDGRSDIYSLGCVMYECLSGQPPFTGPSPQAVLARHTLDPVPRLRTLRPTVPEGVQQAVEKALAKVPADRFSTAAEFAQALTGGAVRSDMPESLDAVIRQALARNAAGRIADAAQSAPALLESVTAGATSTPSAVHPKRLVVLPFTNLSPEPDSQYFADGLTEELITDLSRIRALRVISRTSAMRLRDSGKDVPTIARELGVHYVLDGSVRKAGRSIRITAHLVEATADASLWAEKFSGSDEDVFVLQESLSRQIVNALRITLTPAESSRIAHRPIEDPRAYDCFLRARHKLLRFSGRDLDDALALLGEGLKIVGDNELLLGAMGQVYVYYVHWGVRPDPKYLDEAERCVQGVFRLNPNSAQGHAVLGGLHLKRGELQEAVRHLRRAVDVDPEHLDALIWLFYCYITAGQPGAARPIIEHLLEIDPLTALNHAAYGWLLVCENRIPEAVSHYQRGYQLEPASPVIRWLYGWSLAQSGRRDEAAAELATFAKEAQGTIFGPLAGALGHALVGDAAAARYAASPLLASAMQQDEGTSFCLSEIFALVRDYDEALRWLEHAIERGNLNYPMLAEIDTLYGDFRKDPRFTQLLANIRHRWEMFEV
jgi:serine/threonine protein kinase/Tfp pilus assembly protein PilF